MKDYKERGRAKTLPSPPGSFLRTWLIRQSTNRFANLALHVATWKDLQDGKPLQPARSSASSGMAFRDKAIREERLPRVTLSSCYRAVARTDAHRPRWAAATKACGRRSRGWL